MLRGSMQAKFESSAALALTPFAGSIARRRRTIWISSRCLSISKPSPSKALDAVALEAGGADAIGCAMSLGSTFFLTRRDIWPNMVDMQPGETLEVKPMVSEIRIQDKSRGDGTWIRITASPAGVFTRTSPRFLHPKNPAWVFGDPAQLRSECRVLSTFCRYASSGSTLPVLASTRCKRVFSPVALLPVLSETNQ